MRSTMKAMSSILIPDIRLFDCPKEVHPEPLQLFIYVYEHSSAIRQIQQDVISLWYDCFMKAISCDCNQLIEINIVNCVRITSKNMERIILSCTQVSLIDCSGCDNKSSEFFKDEAQKLDFSDLDITNYFVGILQRRVL